MGHLLMIGAGLLMIIHQLPVENFDNSVWFLVALVGLWIWDYNDINKNARNNPASYYNRCKARKRRQRKR